MADARSPLLSVQGLCTHFRTPDGVVKAVDGASFEVAAGKTLCVVGESGSGKSITARSILGIIQKPGSVVAGTMRFRRKDGSVVDLAGLAPKGATYRSIRGGEIGMIFQEPMSALSPVHTIGSQIIENVRLHLGLAGRAARAHAAAILDRVGLPDATRQLDSYPFQLSGGMRQRVCIAMALACQPTLLIADEPTTALDVTTQATIIDLLRELQASLGMALMFITHDLGVVAEIADRVVVMYLGRVVERGTAEAIFTAPKHPYTRGLLRCVPDLSPDGRLEAIPGIVPHPLNRPPGCPFNPRCRERIAGLCERIAPAERGFADGSSVECHLWDEARAETAEAAHG
jgi:peptide/nickel transport system ATP-binding protein